MITSLDSLFLIVEVAPLKNQSPTSGDTGGSGVGEAVNTSAAPLPVTSNPQRSLWPAVRPRPFLIFEIQVR